MPISDFTNLLKWDRLAAIGNNPIARLTIVAPLIAPITLYSDYLAKEIDRYFDFHVSAGGLPWLYVSLIFLSLAQWLYVALAPKPAKQYVSRADYVRRGLSEYGPNDWPNLCAKFATWEYERSKLAFIDDIIEKIELLTEIANKQALINGFKYYSEKGSIHPSHLMLFHTFFETHSKTIFKGKVDEDKLIALRKVLALNRAGGNEQQITSRYQELLRIDYNIKNEQMPFARIIIGLLYLAGFSYFAYHIPKGIISNFMLIGKLASNS